MRPITRRAVIATACLSAMLLAGCGPRVAADAPVTWAPADTPYLFANLEPVPAAVSTAWNGDGSDLLKLRIGQLGQYASLLGDQDPTIAKVFAALHDELQEVETSAQLLATTGMSAAPLYAVYGIGDVPVARMELQSPETFKAFWSRVEKRAGISVPTTTVAGQAYWRLGSADAKAQVLIAVQGRQLLATLAPAQASQELLKRLLGLDKPASNAVERLAKINSRHAYGAYGSGYIDLRQLFANLFDGHNATTQAFIQGLGTSMPASPPACASEFDAIARQVPLTSFGMQTATAKAMRYSIDVELAPGLRGALTALQQPVPGMAARDAQPVLDWVLALPVQKWQTFLHERAKAAAARTWQCPLLQPISGYVKSMAANPPQLPAEVASLLGFRLVLDKWEAGPQLAGRALVASSDPAALAAKLQQTLPQFALKTIPLDGKPVAFELPAKLQAMLGGGNQAWLAADRGAIAAGFGDGAEVALPGTLTAAAGNGERLLRVHFDGKLYGVLGSWISRFAALAPEQSRANVQASAALMQRMAEIVATADAEVGLDDEGLHLRGEIRHR